jgi:MFS transporter, PAT family, beta-lactamase induction signal transducer AmpG
MPAKFNIKTAWNWVPSLYFAQGIPYVIVMSVSVIMYKRMGISNTDIALYTSWLYLPWIIKPLWSPVVDILKTKRFWIITMQLIVGAGLAGVAFTIPVSDFFQYTLAFFWLLAFSSATHDIAADGFYMIALSKHDQAWFVGIRSTFYRIAMIFGQGVLIILAGFIESNSGLPSVDLNVNANPGTQIQQYILPQDLKIEPEEGDTRIIIYPAELNISTQQIDKRKTDSIVSFAKDWNISNGFYSEERKTETVINGAGVSWWDYNIADPLERFLRRHFAPDKSGQVSAGSTGNFGIVYLYLSSPPEDDQIAVNFGRESGDNSISLIEGGRILFTRDNWNIPAMAVIQLDPKLRTESLAYFKARSGNIPLSWIVTFLILTGLFIVFFIYHKFILPHPAGDKSVLKGESMKDVFSEFFRTFALFFKKEKIGLILAFILLYRLGEAQLVKLAAPFLLDTQEAGGLALTLGQVGFVYGTVGIIALTLGGITGGILAARNGLKYWIWWMVLAINIPDINYIYLAYTQTSNLLIINAAVAIEQFGYGFGFTAFMLYMIYIAEGDHKTAHYAIATGFMALGMMLPGMFSGWLQEIIGYRNFFIWVLLSTIPAFIITKFIPLDRTFGRKTEAEGEK